MGDFFYSTFEDLVLQEVKKRPNIYAKKDDLYKDEVAREMAWVEVFQSVNRQKKIPENMGGN